MALQMTVNWYCFQSGENWKLFCFFFQPLFSVFSEQVMVRGEDLVAFSSAWNFWKQNLRSFLNGNLSNNKEAVMYLGRYLGRFCLWQRACSKTKTKGIIWCHSTLRQEKNNPWNNGPWVYFRNTNMMNNSAEKPASLHMVQLEARR